MRKEDLGIGVYLLWGADEAVVLVFMWDDPSNCEVYAGLVDLQKMNLSVGSYFSTQLLQKLTKVKLFILHSFIRRPLL